MERRRSIVQVSERNKADEFRELPTDSTPVALWKAMVDRGREYRPQDRGFIWHGDILCDSCCVCFAAEFSVGSTRQVEQFVKHCSSLWSYRFDDVKLVDLETKFRGVFDYCITSRKTLRVFERSMQELWDEGARFAWPIKKESWLKSAKWSELDSMNSMLDKDGYCRILYSLGTLNSLYLLESDSGKRDRVVAVGLVSFSPVMESHDAMHIDFVDVRVNKAEMGVTE